jgi:hypothetical protein
MDLSRSPVRIKAWALQDSQRLPKQRVTATLDGSRFLLG